MYVYGKQATRTVTTGEVTLLILAGCKLLLTEAHLCWRGGDLSVNGTGRIHGCSQAVDLLVTYMGENVIVSDTARRCAAIVPVKDVELFYNFQCFLLEKHNLATGYVQFQIALMLIAKRLKWILRSGMHIPWRRCSGKKLVERLAVHPQGQLKVAGAGVVQLSIRPLDPVSHPHQDVVVVYTDGGQGALQCSQQTTQNQSFVDVKLRNYGCCPVTFDVQTPIKYDICCHLLEELTDRSWLSIEGLECETVTVELTAGHCQLDKIKCSDVNVRVGTGVVNSKTSLQGNFTIDHAGTDGGIRLKTVHGSMTCTSNAAPIGVEAMYGDLSVRTNTGDVTIGNHNGNCHIRVKDQGHVTIDSFEGPSMTCRVPQGSVQIHNCNHDTLDVSVNTGRADSTQYCVLRWISLAGDVKVNLSERCQRAVTVQSPATSVSEQLHATARDQRSQTVTVSGRSENPSNNEPDSNISVLNGRVTMGVASWCESLLRKLGEKG